MNINKKVCKYCNNIKDFFKTKFKCVDCYIKINKETKIKSRNKLYVKALLNSCYNSDKKKDREFDISEDFIKNIINKQNNKCNYCNKKLSNNMEILTPNRISIDRINSKIGHIKSNVAISCYFCNMIKNNLENKYSKLPGWIVYKNYCGWCFCYNTNNGKKTIIHKSFNDKELGSSKALVSSIIENVLFNFEKLIK